MTLRERSPVLFWAFWVVALPLWVYLLAVTFVGTIVSIVAALPFGVKGGTRLFFHAAHVMGEVGGALTKPVNWVLFWHGSNAPATKHTRCPYCKKEVPVL